MEKTFKKAGAAALLLLLSSCAVPNDTKTPPVETPESRVVDHTNFDPSRFTDAQIQAAAQLNIYFEHASVGQDIVGNSLTDTSGGNDSDDVGDCGLALLHKESARYLAVRTSSDSGPEWFDTHSGWMDNARGNPGAEVKTSTFTGSLGTSLADKLDVATYKFCWIDTPTDGKALFDSAKAAQEALETAHPGISFIWWTMPIGCEEAPKERQVYNDLVRDYCRTNNKWLLDIADLETHGSTGEKSLSQDGWELMQAEWAVNTGGDNHLNDSGKLRMAKAWWTLMASLAKSRA